MRVPESDGRQKLKEHQNWKGLILYVECISINVIGTVFSTLPVYQFDILYLSDIKESTAVPAAL